jgi:hypothetical protein
VPVELGQSDADTITRSEQSWAQWGGNFIYVTAARRFQKLTVVYNNPGPYLE